MLAIEINIVQNSTVSKLLQLVRVDNSDVLHRLSQLRTIVKETA